MLTDLSSWSEVLSQIYDLWQFGQPLNAAFSSVYNTEIQGWNLHFEGFDTGRKKGGHFARRKHELVSRIGHTSATSSDGRKLCLVYATKTQQRKFPKVILSNESHRQYEMKVGPIVLADVSTK